MNTEGLINDYKSGMSIYDVCEKISCWQIEN